MTQVLFVALLDALADESSVGRRPPRPSSVGPDGLGVNGSAHGKTFTKLLYIFWLS